LRRCNSPTTCTQRTGYRKNNYPFLFDFIDKLGYTGWMGRKVQAICKTRWIPRTHLNVPVHLTANIMETMQALKTDELGMHPARLLL
jgi:hypothetical protein